MKKDNKVQGYQYVTINTDHGPMTVKDFIWESKLYPWENDPIKFSLNKKTILVSHGEGGNRHLYIRVKTKHGMQDVIHIWYDVHGYRDVVIINTIYPYSSQRLFNKVVWCVGKNSNGRANDSYWYIGSIDNMAKVIIDLMTYLK